MDATLTAEWIGAVAGFVVWFFSWLWTLWTDRRARKRIRTMITLEIEDNLSGLRAFVAAVEVRVNFTNVSHLATMQRGDALSAIPLPEFSHRIWETLTSSLPVGLNEDEIRQVYHSYSELNELTRLKGISHDPRSQWRPEVEGVLNGLLEKGNPIS